MYAHLYRKALLPFHGRLRKRHYLDRAAFLRDSQWWRPEQIRAFQLSELKRLLKHAVTTVPYYRYTYRAAGIHVDDIRCLDDFSKLPPLLRGDIREHGADLCSESFPGKLIPHTTGGSTGTPTRINFTIDSYDWRTACKDRVYSWSGWELGERALYLWGAPLTPSNNWKLKLFQRFQGQTVFNTFSQTENLWRSVHVAFERRRPVSLVGYVSSLEEFARYAIRVEFSSRSLRSVIAAAEPLHPTTRALLEKAFGVPVFNTYGAREVMSIAGECSLHDGLHVNSENVFVETCKVDGTSSLLITDLHNYGMPLLRYEIGDCGELEDTPCACGRGLPRLFRIDGRTMDIVRTPSGIIVPGEFFPHLLKDVRQISHFQVRQVSTNSLEISVVLHEPLSEDATTLIQRQIAIVTHSEMTTRIRQVKAIPVLASGKRRVVVGLK